MGLLDQHLNKDEHKSLLRPRIFGVSSTNRKREKKTFKDNSDYNW